MDGDDEGPGRQAGWQRLLLPFALVVVFGASAYFMWTSVSQFEAMKVSVERSFVDERIVPLIERSAPAGTGDATPQVRLMMEERAQRADLTRAGASLLISLWTRNMGFVTGMLMALIGAIFILSRINDAGSTLEARQGALTGSLKTSSPGIVLAVLGTVLMVLAMTTRYTETSREMTTESPRDSDGAIGGPDQYRVGDDSPSVETCREAPTAPGCAAVLGMPMPGASPTAAARRD